MNKKLRFFVYRIENGDEIRIAVFDSEQYAVDYILYRRVKTMIKVKTLNEIKQATHSG